MLNFGLMLLARATQALVALTNGLTCVIASQSCHDDR